MFVSLTIVLHISSKGSYHRLIIEQDRNRQVADSSSVKLNLTDPCRTVPYQCCVAVLKDARPAGWVSCFSICASTMPRAQNMTEKGSILKQRRNTLTIWVYDLSMLYTNHFPFSSAQFCNYNMFNGGVESLIIQTVNLRIKSDINIYYVDNIDKYMVEHSTGKNTNILKTIFTHLYGYLFNV